MLEVSGLFIYPVKSCAGLTLARATLSPGGFENDRRWMIVDDAGLFLTQRTWPRMCLIEVGLDGELLTLRFEGRAIEVPPALRSGPLRSVRVWDDEVQARGAAPEVDRFLSDALGTSCHLVEDLGERRMPEKRRLPGAHDRVSFADAYPLLLLSEASLADLASRVELPLRMNRFRPNVVIRGAHPFEEDEHSRLSIRAHRFFADKPCGRCTIVTVEQETGQSGKEPLATLAHYRRRGNDAMFGQNLRLSSEIRAGDSLVLGDPVVWLDDE